MADFKHDWLEMHRKATEHKRNMLLRNRSDVNESTIESKSDEAYEMRNDNKLGEIDDNSNLGISTADKYITMLSRNCKRYLLDKVYGVYKQGDMLMIGDSPIQFENNCVKVKDVNYILTKGLLELLFKGNPDGSHISSDDIANYRKIIKDTSAHRSRHRKDRPLRKSKSDKFRKFIAPLCLSPQYEESQSNINKENHAISIPKWNTSVSSKSEEEYSSISSSSMSFKSEDEETQDLSEGDEYQNLSNYSSINSGNVCERERNDLDFDTKFYSNSFNPKRKYVDSRESGLSSSFKRLKKRAIDYENWDDPNELVDQLRLLVAEQTAGNLSNFLEIQTILEKLHNAGYIQCNEYILNNKTRLDLYDK